MSVSVLAPVTQITLNGLIPYVLQSCVLVAPVPTPDPEPEPEPEDFIFVPVPPGIEYDSLPVIDPETQIIDTSPDQIIGCANDLPVGVEQQVLGALFPDAEAGDGIVNRDNNDVWTYDGSAWTNVGPTPGPQIVQVSILPPWNEIVFLNARVRTRLGVQSLAYALDLISELDPITTRTGLSVIIPVSPASISIGLQAFAPYIAGAVTSPIAAVIGIDALAPSARTGYSAFVPSRSITLGSLPPVAVGADQSVIIQPSEVSISTSALSPSLSQLVEFVVYSDGTDLTSTGSVGIVDDYGTTHSATGGPFDGPYIESNTLDSGFEIEFGPANPLSEDYTLQIWYRKTLTSTFLQIFQAYTFMEGTTPGRYSMQVDNGNTTTTLFCSQGTSSPSSTLTYSTSLVSGEWRMLAVVREGAETRFYDHGVLVTNVAFTLDWIWTEAIFIDEMFMYVPPDFDIGQIKMTKGAALYSGSTMTVPSSPFV
jgi:hypothetical protein